MIDFQNGSVFKLKKADNSAAKDVEALFITGEKSSAVIKGYGLCGIHQQTGNICKCTGYDWKEKRLYFSPLL